MGGFLDKPITDKHITEGQNAKLKFTSCEMQGWRMYMEDSKLTQLELEGYPNMSLFAVFDGHGGSEVSKYVENHFVSEFIKRKSLKDGNIEAALRETFVQMDLLLKSYAAIQEQIKYKEQTTGAKNVQKTQLEAGCTAIVVVITPDKIFAANAGDSRAVLYQDGKTVPLSEDHKPSLEREKQRITNAGATIINGRVNGNLNLTRAIGDFSSKNVPKIPFHLQPIICVPYIEYIDRTGKEEFLVLGCDGIWYQYYTDMSPFMNNISSQLKKSTPTKEILYAFFDYNISKGGIQPHGRDNMTAVVVEFLQ